MDVARIITSTSAGPRGMTDQLFLIAIAHAGPFKSAAEWRPFALTYAMNKLGCAEGTAIKALDRLEANGWITSRVRRGCPTQFAINEAKLTPPTSEGGTTQAIVGGTTQKSEGAAPREAWGVRRDSPPKQAGVDHPNKLGGNHPNKLGTDQSSSEFFREERGGAPAHEPADSFAPPSWQGPVQRILDEHFGMNFRLETAVLGWLENGHKILPADIADRSKAFELELTARVARSDFGPNPQWVLEGAAKRWAKHSKPAEPTNAPAINTDINAIRRAREKALAEMRANSGNPWSRNDDE